jgi:hypothetical protein
VRERERWRESAYLAKREETPNKMGNNGANIARSAITIQYKVAIASEFNMYR